MKDVILIHLFLNSEPTMSLSHLPFLESSSPDVEKAEIIRKPLRNTFALIRTKSYNTVYLLPSLVSGMRRGKINPTPLVGVEFYWRLCLSSDSIGGSADTKTHPTRSLRLTQSGFLIHADGQENPVKTHFCQDIHCAGRSLARFLYYSIPCNRISGFKFLHFHWLVYIPRRANMSYSNSKDSIVILG